MRKIVRSCCWWMFIGVTLLGLALIAIQRLTPLLDNYSASLQTYLSQRLNLPVHIKAVHASWWLIHPKIVLEEVDIRAPDAAKPAAETVHFHVHKLNVRIDILRSLWHRHMVTSNIALERAQLHVPVLKKPAMEDPSYENKWEWFLSQRHWSVTNSHLIVEKSTAGPTALHLKSLEVDNRGKRHHVHGKLVWDQEGILTVDANLRGKPYSLGHWHGVVTGQGDHIRLGSLQQMVQPFWGERFTITKGEAGFTLSSLLQQGQWQQLKSDFHVTQLAVAHEDRAVEVDHLKGKLHWDRRDPTAQWVQGQFNDVRIADKKRGFEVAHLNGDIKWLPTLQEMDGSFTGDPIQVNMQGWPAPVQNVQLWTHWQLVQNNGIPELRLLKGRVRHRKLQGQIEGSVQFAPEGPVVAALGRVITKPLDKRAWHDHVPAVGLSQGLYEWLAQAIDHAGPTESRFVVQGPLKRFPFDNEEGTFALETHYNDVTLNYSWPWPPLTEVAGSLQFHNRSFTLKAHTGRVNGLAIKQLEASIEHLGTDKNPLLIVKSEGQGDVQQGLSFLKNSPLRHSMGSLVNALSAKGEMALQLRLAIPLGLESPKKDVDVLGEVDITKGVLAIPQWDLTVHDLGGKLRFTADTLRADHLQGQWEGGKVAATISTLNSPQQRLTKLEVHGDALSDALVARLPGLGGKTITGHTAFQLSTLLTDKGLQSLQVQSSLQGLGLALPKPFTKPAHTAAPSQLSVSFHNEKPIKALFNLGKILNGALTFEQSKSGTQLRSGAVRLGEQGAQLPAPHVLTLDGHLDTVDAAEWGPLLFTINTAFPSKTTVQPRIGLFVEDLDLWHQHFHQVGLKAVGAPGAWQLKIDSKTAKGNITLPKNDPTLPVQVSLDYLYLTPLGSNYPNSVTAFPLSSMPGIDFVCEDFHLGKRRFGRLRLGMTPHKGSMSVDWLSSDPQYYNLLAQGEWNNTGSHLVGDIKLFDVAATLRYWQVPDNVHGKQGNVHFDLRWPRGLFAATLPALQGNVDVQLGAGRIEGLSSDTEQKLDMGRLVTLLNLRSLPKRLSFDFSDLTHDGLSYDTLKGNFALKQGILSTSNARLDGSVTRVDMKGELDLLEKQYDLLFRVVPHYTSSLPVVATLAGGPVAGLATWVVDKALSHEVDKMVAQWYTVQGPWDDPVVKSAKQE